MEKSNRVIYCVLTPTFEPDKVGVKIGYSQNIFKRLPIYYTHNPFIKVIGTIKVYQKTKRKVEAMIHNEVISQGFEFIKVCGITTEWFIVHRDSEFYKALINDGLGAVFKTCKNRQFVPWDT